jgi:hypothetical protein
MPFTNSVSQSMPGYGSPSLYGYVANTAAAAATTSLAVPAAAHPAPTGFSVAAGTPGTATAVFAAVAIYADGSVGPAVYYTLTTANASASTYTPTITAPSDAVTGTTKYELWYVGSVGATQGTLYLGPAVIGSFSGTASASLTIGTPGTTTFTSPFSSFNPTGMPAPSRGKYRIRTSSVGSTGTTTVLVTVTDGTTTLEVGAVGTTAAGQAIDETKEFNTDLSITSITAAVTMAVAGQTSFAEFEVSLV